MSKTTKENIAYAEMVAQMLWINGLITQKERDIINEHTRKRIQGNC